MVSVLDSSNRSGRSSTGPVRLRPDLISLPQNDFRHVGHVGINGEMFGDIGLMSSALSENTQGAFLFILRTVLIFNQSQILFPYFSR